MVAVQLKFVDAGDLYASWRWEHEPDRPRAWRFPRALVEEALADWARAVPSPLPGERADQALVRSLTHGPLLDLARETELSGRLARAVFPGQLGGELNSLLEQGIRPHLRVQSSPSTALVPWESLRVDEGERTVHHSDVSVLTPATVRNAHGRRVSPFSPHGTVVSVVDPVVPGFADDSALGSVLGPDSPFDRSTVDRDDLERALADASRFLYVGHVTTGDHALDSRLHLSCDTTSTGRAAPIGAHRPLTAADIALGHRPGAPSPWRLPNRVALIACDSGGDTRFAEPTGLVAAVVHGGAEYTTATRWTLPTDAGLRHLVPNFPTTPVLLPAVRAIDHAQSAPDPVAAQCAWQRDQADEWERTGDPTRSPVIWAAFGTAWTPAPR
ncbi:CHAT domain-containing protein [Umezawaea endophytica]|uniref:CHAT domain-containing protein n=1 Tax=Umezawaea endophytica TaxID=1654476 RepID=A0A9X2VIW5_9PSEU|nr:CHAT domain-containing protein [Umezawaea endophytica]MCS7477545.1 CHAT domain-containing protein [Umezawaea endophytica]